MGGRVKALREEGDCLRNRKVASVAAGQGPRLGVEVGMEPHEAGKMGRDQIILYKV